MIFKLLLVRLKCIPFPLQMFRYKYFTLYAYKFLTRCVVLDYYCSVVLKSWISMQELRCILKSGACCDNELYCWLYYTLCISTLVVSSENTSLYRVLNKCVKLQVGTFYSKILLRRNEIRFGDFEEKVKKWLICCTLEIWNY